MRSVFERARIYISDFAFYNFGMAVPHRTTKKERLLLRAASGDWLEQGTYLDLACLATRTSRSGFCMPFAPAVGMSIGANIGDENGSGRGDLLQIETTEMWNLGFHAVGCGLSDDLVNYRRIYYERRIVGGR
jgi:hypothetical protein